MNANEVVVLDATTSEDSDVEVVDLKRKAEEVVDPEATTDDDDTDEAETPKRTLIPSPIRLTKVAALPDSENVDTVTLASLIRHANLSHMV